MKAGKVDEANKIEKGTLGTTTGVGRNAANELSLIEFDAEPSENSTQASSSGQNVSNGSLLEDISGPAASTSQTTVEDDLLGLSIGGPPVYGGISLGGPMSSDFFGTSTTSPPAPQPAQATTLAPAPTTIQAPKPNYDAFASLSSSLPRSKPATPNPAQQQRQTSTSIPPTDPFAALISSVPRSITPLGQHNGHQPIPNSLPPSGLANTTSNSTNTKTSTTAADDEWDFVSAPPEQSSQLPQKSTLTVHDNGKVKIVLECMRQPNQSMQPVPIFIRASFTNPTTSPISELHFQVAVEKAYSLQLKPQSGKLLPPYSAKTITQELQISNVPEGKGTAVKIRFKVAYSLNGTPQEEQGMVTSLGIA